MRTMRRQVIGAFSAGAMTATVITMALMTPWHAGAAPGDTDATFVPITACRLTDTRPAPNRVGEQGSFGLADTKTFQATGANGECVGIPSAAVALSMNVTALDSTQQSYLTFWGSGERPLAASLNPAPGEPPTPNAVTTELSSAGSFNIYNNAGSVNVVIDVNGYYTKSSLQSLQSQIDAVESSHGAELEDLQGDIAALQVDITSLQADRPFAATAENGTSTIIGFGKSITESIAMVAPSDGTITVWSTAVVSDLNPGAVTGCYLTTNTTADGLGERGYHAPSGAFLGSIDGVRSFDVLPGQHLTIDHVCRRAVGPGTSEITATRLVAIFTPTP